LKPLRIFVVMPGVPLALLILAASAAGSSTVASGGADPEGLKWKSYSEGRKEAQADGKKVLIDVYTTWCGWCRKMDRDVYENDAVREYILEHFIPVKLNAESQSAHEVDSVSVTERQISGAYGISSYPTTVFLEQDGSTITVLPGYIKAGTFLRVLEYIAEEKYKTTSWDDFLRSREKP
jgi:thioredoxin-related protein